MNGAVGHLLCCFRVALLSGSTSAPDWHVAGWRARVCHELVAEVCGVAEGCRAGPRWCCASGLWATRTALACGGDRGALRAPPPPMGPGHRRGAGAVSPRLPSARSVWLSRGLWTCGNDAAAGMLSQADRVIAWVRGGGGGAGVGGFVSQGFLSVRVFGLLWQLLRPPTVPSTHESDVSGVKLLEAALWRCAPMGERRCVFRSCWVASGYRRTPAGCML